MVSVTTAIKAPVAPYLLAILILVPPRPAPMRAMPPVSGLRRVGPGCLLKKAIMRCCEIVARSGAPTSPYETREGSLGMVRPLHGLIKGPVGARIHHQLDDGFVAGPFGNVEELLASVRTPHPRSGAVIASRQMPIVRALCRNGHQRRQAE